MVNTDKTICRMIASMLAGYGVKDVVISPGSRNTPLVMAICRNPVLRTRQIVDERTAAFIARPVARYSISLRPLRRHIIGKHP